MKRRNVLTVLIVLLCSAATLWAAGAKEPAATTASTSENEFLSDTAGLTDGAFLEGVPTPTQDWEIANITRTLMNAHWVKNKEGFEAAGKHYGVTANVLAVESEQDVMDQLPALEKNPDVAVRRYDGQFVEYVYVNNTRPTLSDKRVRQALNYAVDFKGIIDFVLQGNGDQAISPIPKGMWGHDDKAFRYERNPEKARALLAEAGVKDLSLTLIYSERRAVWEQIATILQSNFADIGVKLDLVLLSNATLRDRMGNGDFDLCLGAWSPDFADPYMFANLWYDSANAGMAGNRSFYSNPKVDDLLRKAARSTNQAERVDLYKQVQDIVIDDAAYILLYQLKAVVPMRTNVKGFVFNPMLESMYNIESMWKE